mgnify:CR=1 FL=1
MNVDLPIISPDANPDFIDANTCAQWLQGLPLINVGPSHGRLLGQLEELPPTSRPSGRVSEKVHRVVHAEVKVRAGDHIADAVTRGIANARRALGALRSPAGEWQRTRAVRPQSQRQIRPAVPRLGGYETRAPAAAGGRCVAAGETGRARRGLALRHQCAEHRQGWRQIERHARQWQAICCRPRVVGDRTETAYGPRTGGRHQNRPRHRRQSSA